jgi:shikimate dehydrogenase
VFDMVYNPLETRLLHQARRSGGRAIDGLGMLVRQGALAFDLWTNQGLELEEIAAWMRAACERASTGITATASTKRPNPV